MDTYWVSWIAKDFSGKPYLSGLSTASADIQTAKQEIEFQIQSQEESLVAIWISVFDKNNNHTKTLFHQVFVDSMGIYTRKKTLTAQKCKPTGNETKP